MGLSRTHYHPSLPPSSDQEPAEVPAELDLPTEEQLPVAAPQRRGDKLRQRRGVKSVFQAEEEEEQEQGSEVGLGCLFAKHILLLARRFSLHDSKPPPCGARSCQRLLQQAALQLVAS